MRPANRFARGLGCGLALAVTIGYAAAAASLPAAPLHRPAVPQHAPGGVLGSTRALQSQKIQHVVVVIQENRSLDNLFHGYPGADTVSSGLAHKVRVRLHPIPMEAKIDISHSVFDFLNACDGGPQSKNCKMDGFDAEGYYPKPNPYGKYVMYGYVPQAQTAPYFAMASQYVLADHTFASNLDGSFVAHQYLIAAQANHAVELPSGQWGCPGGNGTVLTLTQTRHYGPAESACFNYQTVGDELDGLKLSWRYYADAYLQPAFIWSAYQAVDHIYHGPDWTKDVISPHDKFLADVGAGKLSAVTWVVPDCPHSDHSNPFCGGNLGPQWVTQIVNTVGQSNFWNSTAIFVVWDEWGGWYDHVPPPYMDYDGLGFRVPMLVISPYAKRGHVSHKQYETASIVRFIEDTFGLGQLAAADTRALSPAFDCFDFSQPPRPFTPFASKPLRRPVSYGDARHPPDDN